MKKVLFLINIFVFISCTSYQDKNIFYKLSHTELKEFLNEYPQSEQLYKTIEKIRNSSSDIDKIKYEDLTYKRVLECMKFAADTAYWFPIRDSLVREWDKDYPYRNPDSLKYDLKKSYFIRAELDKIIKNKDELVYQLMMESRE